MWLCVYSVGDLVFVVPTMHACVDMWKVFMLETNYDMPVYARLHRVIRTDPPIVTTIRLGQVNKGSADERRAELLRLLRRLYESR